LGSVKAGTPDQPQQVDLHMVCVYGGKFRHVMVAFSDCFFALFGQKKEFQSTFKGKLFPDYPIGIVQDYKTAPEIGQTATSGKYGQHGRFPPTNPHDKINPMNCNNHVLAKK